MAYTSEDVQDAIVTYATADDNISYRDVGSMFGVPKSTLFEKTRKYVSRVSVVPVVSKAGRRPILILEDEEAIAQWVRKMADAGFPVTNKELLDSIQHSLNRSKKITGFTNNRPTAQWIPKFKKRHNLSLRIPETLDAAKALITPDYLEKWSDHVKNYLKLVVVLMCNSVVDSPLLISQLLPHTFNLPQFVALPQHIIICGNFQVHFLKSSYVFRNRNLGEIFTDPTRWFNSDESFFLISPGKEKVLAPTGTKDVYLVHKSSSKSGVSVLATISASGWILPPFIIYPYKRSQRWMDQNQPPGIESFCTKKGWMTVDAFCFWLLNQFLPELKGNQVKFPVVLFIDGHRSHINIRISDICFENDIILICFPPNTTHILQPCDVALFKPLKEQWRSKVSEWTNKHPQNKVTIQNMARLLHEVWQNLPLKYGKNGFRACGLFPWNPAAVRITKCISTTSSKSDSSAPEQSQNESQIETDQNNNFPSRSVQFSASAGRISSSLDRSTNLELNPLYIGHAILAEFESSLSTVEIDQFVSILKQEESSADATCQDNLSEILKIKYGIWKGLIRRYFGHISTRHGESSLAPVTIQKLDLGPVPSVPEKSFRKRELSSPILTGERAKKQLADREKRKQGRGKRRDDEFDEDFDEDFDEGYHQYMAMNGMAQCSRNVSPKTSKTLEDTIITVDLEELETSSKAKGKKIVKAGKGLLLEGTRRSSRLIAKSKIEEEVEVRKIVDVKTAKDPTSTFYETLPEDSTEVLCFYCKELGTVGDCNRCRLCDAYIHESCFPRAILLSKFGISSYCCPYCTEMTIANRDNLEAARLVF